MKQEKIYLGNAKKGKDFEWGTVYNGAICLTGLKDYFAEYGFKGEKNGKQYIPISVVLGSKPDQYGNEISIQVNTWKPDKKAETKKEEELPF